MAVCVEVGVKNQALFACGCRTPTGLECIVIFCCPPLSFAGTRNRVHRMSCSSTFAFRIWDARSGRVGDTLHCSCMPRFWVMRTPPMSLLYWYNIPDSDAMNTRTTTYAQSRADRPSMSVLKYSTEIRRLTERILQNIKSCGLLASRCHESPSPTAAGRAGAPPGGACRESSKFRVSESHGGKPPGGAPAPPAAPPGGACRESAKFPPRECSCSTQLHSRQKA